MQTFFSIPLPKNSKQGCFPNKKDMLSKKSLKDFEMPDFGLQILTLSAWVCLLEIILKNAKPFRWS